MKIRIAGFSVLCLAIFMALVLPSNSTAQGKMDKMDKGAMGKMDKNAKVTNIQGDVQAVDQAKSTITVIVEKAARPIMFSGDTKFLYGHSDNNKPGAIAQIKKGNFIACSGSLDTKGQFVAKECVYRESK
jgi:hypothetical protein